jgi:hypothetical protein
VVVGHTFGQILGTGRSIPVFSNQTPQVLPRDVHDRRKPHLWARYGSLSSFARSGRCSTSTRPGKSSSTTPTLTLVTIEPDLGPSVSRRHRRTHYEHVISHGHICGELKEQHLPGVIIGVCLRNFTRLRKPHEKVHVSMPNCEHLVIGCQQCNAVGPTNMQLQTATKCSTNFTIADKLLLDDCGRRLAAYCHLQ